MPRYQVGDVVMVRPDLIADEYYDDIYVTEEMEELAGRPVTISDIMGDNATYTVVETDQYAYVWAESMFSGLADMDTLYGPGDTVFVREDIKPGVSYEMVSGEEEGIGDFVTEKMMKLAGSKVTIVSVHRGKYVIEEDGNEFNWTDMMFSGLAKEIEVSTDDEMLSLFGIPHDGGAA